MSLNNKMEELLESQKSIIEKYEKLIREINVDNSINENIKLKKEVEQYRQKVNELEKTLSKISKENISLNMSLKEQMINEKSEILNISKKKTEIYFEDEVKKGVNKLENLESIARSEINRLNKMIESEIIDNKQNLFDATRKVHNEIEENIKQQKVRLKEEKESSLNKINQKYNNLRQEDISEDVLEKKKRHNDLEVKIGLNWINKAGIIIFLLGILTVMKYTYTTWFNEYMKCISGFILGAGFLGIGELFNKREKNLFALGLCGGGLATLYITVFSGYFILNILSLSVSIFLSILITMISLILSNRYSSRTICGLSLVGGYLPFFSFLILKTILGNQIYIAMGYLLILNLLVLGVSLKRRWIHINYLSFILNIPCLIFLVSKSNSDIVSIIYAITTFMMYLGITLIYPIKDKVKLNIVDLVLLSINTITNCLIVYKLFEQTGMELYKGALAFIYAIVYLCLGKLVDKSASQEEYIGGLFYITALTFTILMIPFQFEFKWVILGWLVEAILIITYANKKELRKMELGGWGILSLCTLVFFRFNFIYGWDIEQFTLKYTLMTIGYIYILAIYILNTNKKELFKHTEFGKFINYYKYFTIISTWMYTVIMIARGYEVFYSKCKEVYLQSGYIYFIEDISIPLITFVLAYLISKIEIIKDKVVIGIYTTMYVVADLIFISLNSKMIGYGGQEHSILRNICIVILLLYNILVFFNVKDLTLKLISKRKLSLEFYPLIMGIYLLGVSPIIIINQFDLENINLVISIFYLLMSISFIAYGFNRHYLIIRRFGLGLSIFATTKLFMFDLYNLGKVGKILAYFSFGLVLIGISYIYQRLGTNKKDEKAK